MADQHGSGEAAGEPRRSGAERRQLWRGEFPGLRPRVTYYAPFEACAGRQSIAGGYSTALARFPIELECIETSAVVNPRAGARITAAQTPLDIILLHHNADELRRFRELAPADVLDDAYVIGLWECDTPSLPAEWLDAFAAVDEIWVPSRFCARAVSASAPAGVPVRVVPQIVAVPAPSRTSGERRAARQAFGIPEAAFSFFCSVDVSQSIERANPAAVLSAFAEACSGNVLAFLIVQFHASASDPEGVRDLRRAHAASNVIFIDLAMDDAPMEALRHAADCFVSAHRAGGSGREIAEMMARGKPAIVTDWSGCTDFCDAATAIMVPAGRTEITHGSGGVWAEPRHPELVAAMQRVLQDTDLATQLGVAGRSTVARLLSADIVSAQIGTIIADLMGRRVQVASAVAEVRERRRAGSSNAAARPIADQRPTISVIVTIDDTAPELLVACVVSVLTQTSSDWELCLCDNASTDPATIACIDRLRAQDRRIRVRRLDRKAGTSAATNAAVDMVSGSYVAFLGSAATLTPSALNSYAEAIRDHPNCAMLYCDEDAIDGEGGYVDHDFKPDWSPDHLESCMYLRHMLVVRKAVFLALGGYRGVFDGAQDFDLALRISAMAGDIVISRNCFITGGWSPARRSTRMPHGRRWPTMPRRAMAPMPG